MGADAVGNAASDEQIAEMERLLHDALDAGAMGFSTLAGAHAQRRRRQPGAVARRPRATSSSRLAGAVRSHPGTQLELIIAGCLNGFSDDDVDLLTGCRSPPTARSTGTCSASPRAACTRSSSRPARAPPRRARASSRSRCRKGVQIRLSFLTGFVLDGLPGWRETFALPVARAHPRAERPGRARPARRAGALAGSGRARQPRAVGAARGDRGLHGRRRRRTRAARSATSRRSRARRRSTRCSTS